MADKSTVFKEVQKQLSRGNIDSAISLWLDYVKARPDATVYNTIGDLFYKKRDIKNAIENFYKAADIFNSEGFATKALALHKKILNIEPNYAPSLIFIGELNEQKGLITEAIRYYLAAVDAYAKTGQKDELKNICNKIFNLSPENIPLRIKIAEYLKKEGYTEEAAEEYINIGRLCEKKGDLNRAQEFYEQVLEIFPKNEKIYNILFDFYISTEQFEKAQGLLSKGIELYPERTDLHTLKAELSLKLGNISEAVQTLHKIIDSLEPNTPEYIKAVKLLANAYKEQGDNKKAWHYYKGIIDVIESENKEDAINILRSLRDASPVEITTKLIEIFEESNNSEELCRELLTLGDIKSESGNYEEALEAYNKAKALKPEEETVITKVAELEERLGIKKPDVEEKPLSEKLVDADIFIRYGLTEEALDLLERLKVEEPENIEVHTKLKDLYLEINDKERAISECLVLARLYERAGDIEQKERAINEAFEIDPNDPRLLELAGQPEDILTGTNVANDFQGIEIPGLDVNGNIETKEESLEEFKVSETEELERDRTTVDLSEELAEADFYYRQGLYDDAKLIYERLLNNYPDNEEIKERLHRVREKLSATESISFTKTPDEEPLTKEEEQIHSEESVSDTTPLEESAISPEELEEVIIEEPSEETPEPQLDTEVLEIFEEFKKGISAELEEDDFETHYNLGIAYKEMGLIDDAIKEFQIARRVDEKNIPTLSMLGACYMDKKLYSLAIDAFKAALENMDKQDEAYWGTKYDLARAFESNGDLKSALDIYIEIYGWDSKFRDVDKKVNALKQALSNEGIIEEDKDEKEEEPKPKRSRISYL